MASKYAITKLDNHIKRPQNCFMIWSSAMRHKYANCKYNNAHTSKILGRIWAAMHDDDKQDYKIMANKISIEHKLKHPNYKYIPKRKYKQVNVNDKKENIENKEKKYKIVKSRKYSKKAILPDISQFIINQEIDHNIHNDHYDHNDNEEPDYFTELQMFYENITSDSIACDL